MPTQNHCRLDPPRRVSCSRLLFFSTRNQTTKVIGSRKRTLPGGPLRILLPGSALSFVVLDKFVAYMAIEPVTDLKDLHGGIGYGFDFCARRMLMEIELLTKSRGLDLEIFQIELVDYHFPSDEERLSRKDEK